MLGGPAPTKAPSRQLARQWIASCLVREYPLAPVAFAEMRRPTLALLLGFIVSACTIHSLHAQDGDRTTAVPRPERSDSWVRIQGDAAAVQLDVRQTRIADVLSALSKFDIVFHSRIQLDEIRNGTYGGSLDYVISRLLDGYDYVIKQNKSKLEVSIYDKRGERAVPAPVPIPTRQRTD
jgi:hypothetical protein